MAIEDALLIAKIHVLPLSKGSVPDKTNQQVFMFLVSLYAFASQLGLL